MLHRTLTNILITFGIVYVLVYLNALYSKNFHILAPLTNVLIMIAVAIGSLIQQKFNYKEDPSFTAKRAEKIRSHEQYEIFIEEDAYREKLTDSRLVKLFYSWLHLREDWNKFSSGDE